MYSKLFTLFFYESFYIFYTYAMIKRFLLLVAINVGILISLNIIVFVLERFFGVPVSVRTGNQQ